MGNFWPFLYPNANLLTAYNEVMVTLSGYVLVFAVLALLWRIGRTTAYAAVIAVSMYLSLVGSGKVLPFMGVMPVAGGSIYFPFVLLALAFAHRQFGNVASLNIIYGGLLGLVFASLGYIHWYMFGVVDSDPDYAYETYMMLHEAGANARGAMLVMVALFLGGIAIIIIKQWLTPRLVHLWRFFIAVGFVILFTTPLFVFITVTKNPVYSNDFLGLLFNTYLIRYSVIWPVFLYLWACKCGCVPRQLMPFAAGSGPHPDDADFRSASYPTPVSRA